MRVTFTKLSGRRYRVEAVTDRHHWVMPTSPGYHDELPHDVAHFLAESQLGIRLGIFGQLAAGGSAGTFHDGAPDGRQRRTSDRLGHAGRDDVARSERLVAQMRLWWDRGAANGPWNHNTAWADITPGWPTRPGRRRSGGWPCRSGARRPSTGRRTSPSGRPRSAPVATGDNRAGAERFAADGAAPAEPRSARLSRCP